MKPHALHSTQLGTVGQSLVPHQGGMGHRPLAQKPEPRSHPRTAFSAAKNWSCLTYSSCKTFPKDVRPFTRHSNWQVPTSNPHGCKSRNASAHTATASEYSMDISSQLRHGHFRNSDKPSETQYTLKNTLAASVFCLALFLLDTKPVIYIAKA